GTVTAVISPETYERARDVVAEDRILLLTGQLDRSSDRPTLKASEVRALDGALNGAAGGHLVVDLPSLADGGAAKLARVQAILGRPSLTTPHFLPQPPYHTTPPAPTPPPLII